MEKQKTKIPRTTKFKSMKPPLPYSQSNVEPPMRTLNTRSRNINSRAPSQPVSRTWLEVQSEVRGVDPTAPHLKYGVFPQRRPAPREIVIRNVSKPVEAHAIIPEHPGGKRERKRTPKKSMLAEAPLFVFRTIDKKNTRHLSQSEILHVDIKPLRNPPMSPIRNPMSPSRNSISPSYAMSPSLSRTCRSLR